MRRSQCMDRKTTKFTFQYVSILIRILCGDCIIKRIYIPICFYFNFHINMTEPLLNQIYIPICFYFNYIFINSNHPFVLFTFQYVSILIFLPQEFLSSAEQFTFQYVSILILNFNLSQYC